MPSNRHAGVHTVCTCNAGTWGWAHTSLRFTTLIVWQASLRKRALPPRPSYQREWCALLAARANPVVAVEGVHRVRQSYLPHRCSREDQESCPHHRPPKENRCLLSCCTARVRATCAERKQERWCAVRGPCCPSDPTPRPSFASKFSRAARLM